MSSHPPPATSTPSTSSAAASAEESSFHLKLDELTVSHWSDTERKALLFMVGCCLPTAAVRARPLAFATSAALAQEVREWRARKERGKPGNEGIASQWETEFLTGLGELLKLEPEAVTASDHSHAPTHCTHSLTHSHTHSLTSTDDAGLSVCSASSPWSV
jgi:hypothetical protein